MTKKVIVLGDSSYKAPFISENFEVIDRTRLKEADLVCFTGGTDIDPSIYFEERTSYINFLDYSRDEIEIQIFEECKKRKIPMVGICRGAQLLFALNGGSLIQHVTNHGSSHSIITKDGQKMIATSSHHQMMMDERIKSIGADVLAWSEKNLSTVYIRDKKFSSPKRELEVVQFKRTRSLCHQPHPEWMNNESPYYRYFFDTIDNLLEN